MLCYKIKCELKEPFPRDERRPNCRDRDFCDELSNKINDYNSWNEGKSSFLIGIDKLRQLELFAVIATEQTVDECIRNFCKKTDIELNGYEAEEITAEMFYKLTSNSRNDYSVDDECLGCFYIKYFFRYNNLFFDEKLAEKNDFDNLKRRAERLLCKKTVVPELKRIFTRSKNSMAYGHPVHYIVQSNGCDNITDILLSALCSSGRVKSSRYAVISFDRRIDFIPYCDYENAFKFMKDGTIIVNTTECSNRRGQQTAIDKEDLDDIFKLAPKYKNDVQVIFVVQSGDEALYKEITYRLGTMTFITLNNDLVMNSKAKDYLKLLCEENHVTADRRLTSLVAKDTGYYSYDLDRFFDCWYSDNLKTKVYPQYSSFERALVEEKDKPAIGSAYDRLSKLIGLDRVKDIIDKAITYSKMQSLYRERGIDAGNRSMHMIFTGNPGTAKTTVARLFAQILKDNKVLSVGKLVECGRSDLVGKYVGWTAVQVKQKFMEAKGSVLFIDEAYSLCDGHTNSFGDEAINTIVQEMENHREDMVVIFAGYPKEMKEFLERNPGLKSRIAYHVEFENYNPQQLLEIANLIAGEKGIRLSEEAQNYIIPIFESAVKAEDFGNGRFARNLVEQAILNQAVRLSKRDYSTVTSDELTTLTAEDFTNLAVDTVSEISQPKAKRIGF